MLTILIAGLLGGAALLGGAPQQSAISFWTDAGTGHAQVWVMNDDGSGRKQRTELFSAKRGDWFPDGSQLAFDGRFYDTLFDFDIGVMNADGSGLRRITSGPERDTEASWSPDGSSIAFTRLQPGKRVPEIWVVRPDGTGLRRLTRADAGDPKWSPDGRRIAFTRYLIGNPEIYVMSSGGGGLRRLTRSRFEDLAAAWSPDGRRILYTHGPEGAHQVYVMNADGSGKTNLSRSRTDDWATDWR